MGHENSILNQTIDFLGYLAEIRSLPQALVADSRQELNLRRQVLMRVDILFIGLEDLAILDDDNAHLNNFCIAPCPRSFQVHNGIAMSTFFLCHTLQIISHFRLNLGLRFFKFQPVPS